MNKQIETLARRLAAVFKLDAVDTLRLEKLIDALKPHFKAGGIWKKAVTIDGEPRCLSYRMFDAVYVLKLILSLKEE